MLSIARFTLYRMFEPAFLGLLILGIFISFFASTGHNFEFSLLGETAQSKGNMTVGSFFLLVLGLIVAVFVGATEIPRDLSSRMVTVILSKPISRTQYVIGRFLGTWFLASFFYFVWLTSMLIVQYFGSDISYNYKIFATNYLYVFTLAPLCALSVAVSTFLEDMAAMIVSFICLAVCFSMIFVLITSVFLNDPDIKRLILLFYYTIPNVAFLFRSFESAIQALAFIGYSIAISCMFLKIGIVHFNERDLC